MRRRPTLPVLFALAAALAAGVAGCSLAPTVAPPEAERTLPGAFAGAADTARADTSLPSAARDTAAYDAVAWWTGFGDPALNALIDTALVRNLDLKRTVAVVDELANQVRVARAPLFPSLNANGSVNRQSQPANVGIGGALGGAGGGGEDSGQPTQTIDRFAFTQYTASLGLSYELDLWGRVRNQRKAALQRFFASVDDLQAVRQQIIAQTISTYFEIATLERQVRLGQETVDLLRERLALTEDRYDRGLVSSFELYTVRQNVEAARAEQPQLERRLYDATGRLAVLLGRFAGDEEAILGTAREATLDFAPIPAGLPSDLLIARPDVRAAVRRVEAARLEIGVARASALPTLALTSEVGTQGSVLAQLVDVEQHFVNLVSSITQPLFRGGQIRAGNNAARARYEQQATTYEQTLLTAFQEVKAALVAYEKEKRRVGFLREQVASARASAANQQRRFTRGLGDYLAFLDARQALAQSRTRLAAAEQAAVGARLTVHRALGGAWVAPPEADDPRLLRGDYTPETERPQTE